MGQSFRTHPPVNLFCPRLDPHLSTCLSTSPICSFTLAHQPSPSQSKLTFQGAQHTPKKLPAFCLTPNSQTRSCNTIHPLYSLFVRLLAPGCFFSHTLRFSWAQPTACNCCGAGKCCGKHVLSSVAEPLISHLPGCEFIFCISATQLTVLPALKSSKVRAAKNSYMIDS